MVVPAKFSSLKKSQVPLFTWIEAIWFCQPDWLSCGCSSPVVTPVPAKFASEKIVTSQVPCGIGGGATSAAACGGGIAPGRGQNCTHCQSAPPSSKLTCCQLSWQPSGVSPLQYGRANPT